MRSRSVLGDLDGRVVLLTGATDGVGRAAATEFAARGATLTIVGRDETKTRRTAEVLRQTTGNPAVDTLIADLSSLRGMRAVTAGFLARRGRLDILVNNAGALFQRPAVTVDGLEMTFALNHLAYFVVTTELIGLLRETPGARVVNTASSAHRFGRLDVEHMPTRSRGAGFVSGFRVYCDSKMANVVFTQELSRRLSPFGVTANCLHPGFVRSRFFGQTTGPLGYATRNPLANLVARPPERAADTLVWLATDPAAAAHSGEYFINRAVRTVSRRTRDERLRSRLWALSERLAAPPTW
jgi:NAD(P)-dependent dehydrogenase (short-subunit alcohol dehydrogenase family)